MNILVTGARGFVGRAVCEHLAGAGHAVRAAARAPLAAGTAGAFFPVRDVCDPVGWDAALSGCEVVVHLAGLAHLPRGAFAAHEVERVNADGTANVAALAARAGVRRFVLMSSVKASGDASVGAPMTEEDAPRPVDAYGRAKLAAERRLIELARQGGMAFTVLRPPLVYGPGVRANFLALMRAVRARRPLPLASVRNARSLVYVGNLAAAVAACVGHPGAADRVFLVSDGEDVSTPGLLRGVAAALGVRPVLFPFPPALLRATATLVGRGEQAARLLDSLQLDTARIRGELGWRPPFSLAEGLAATASWFRAAHG